MHITSRSFGGALAEPKVFEVPDGHGCRDSISLSITKHEEAHVQGSPSKKEYKECKII